MALLQGQRGISVAGTHTLNLVVEKRKSPLQIALLCFAHLQLLQIVLLHHFERPDLLLQPRVVFQALLKHQLYFCLQLLRFSKCEFGKRCASLTCVITNEGIVLVVVALERGTCVDIA